MKMNLMGWLLVALIGMWPTPMHTDSAFSTLLLSANAQSPERKSNALDATAAILSQRYCHVDDTSFSVLMEVKVRLTNTSDTPVILSRRIDSPSVVRVARTTEAGEAGQFEYAPNVDTFVSENSPHPAFGDVPNSKEFIVLSHGETYEMTISTGVFGTKRRTSGHGLINRGSHVLQLAISVWPYYGYEDIDGLRKKWSRLGTLQTGVVYTNLIPFRIPEKFPNPPCSSH